MDNLNRCVEKMRKYYLSPICTNCLGDAVTSISNMFTRLAASSEPAQVFFHHWPHYYNLLWPHVIQPETAVEYIELPTPEGIIIDNNADENFKHLFKVKRSEYHWHPSRAYSKAICKVHPFIVEEIKRLEISDDNIMLNATDLDAGSDYLHFNIKPNRTNNITYQEEAVHRDGKVHYGIQTSRMLNRYQYDNANDVAKYKDVPSLIQAIASAKLHVGFDSGPAHIALACRTPLHLYHDILRGHRSLASIRGIYFNHLDKIKVVQFEA